ncbi:hypothetical protein QBC40DRAFT_1587 [Triangularia verruculosa]|uniref:YAG7-like dimerisation domain-containing protein n=1 Tax=Triangularia verruculosa TaxID=2587418 RepID=A0AAN7B2A7_9PEZI|nr:hypothetical protein QBC40DRAFT_1587 [Triangularia verruculosa]
MAPTTVQNPPAPVESNTAKKKKAKAAAAAAAARTESPAPVASDHAGGENPDDTSENPRIRELSKNIRNVNKKLTNGERIEKLINEHSGKSLEELVEAKIINADQAAAHLKRPAQREQLQQLQDQLATLKQIEAEHRAQLGQLETTLKEKFEREKEQLVIEVKEKVEAEATETLKSHLLALSQFLHLAASRRLADADMTIDEHAAAEGILFHIYAGDYDAVTEMLKLVEGLDEQVIGVDGKKLETTFAKVKEQSYTHLHPDQKPTSTEPEPEFAEELDADEPRALVETDPTVANAGLTEVDDGSAVALTNGHADQNSSTGGAAPSNADVADNAANAAGENQWDTGNASLGDSGEWVSVSVPADFAESSAPPPNPNTWADEQTEATEAAAPADDGFHQVPSRNRGSRDFGNRGRGGFQQVGRGRRAGGFHHDGRGRGGGRGGSRGGDRGGFPARPRRDLSQI